MKVSNWMMRDAPFCRPEDTLADAAEEMLRRNCGSLPVVDKNDEVVAMITDRDICMCSLVEGRPLDGLPISLAMSKELWSCDPADSMDDARRTMTTHRVSRLPVVDDQRKLVGLVRLYDLSRAAETERGAERRLDFIHAVRDLATRKLPQQAEATTV